jgi:hypothetical protein
MPVTDQENLLLDAHLIKENLIWMRIMRVLDVEILVISVGYYLPLVP